MGKGSTVSHAVSDEEFNTEAITDTRVQLQSPVLQVDVLNTILSFCLPVLLNINNTINHFIFIVSDF